MEDGWENSKGHIEQNYRSRQFLPTSTTVHYFFKKELLFLILANPFSTCRLQPPSTIRSHIHRWQMGRESQSDPPKAQIKETGSGPSASHKTGRAGPSQALKSIQRETCSKEIRHSKVELIINSLNLEHCSENQIEPL